MLEVYKRRVGQSVGMTHIFECKNMKQQASKNNFESSEVNFVPKWKLRFEGNFDEQARKERLKRISEQVVIRHTPPNPLAYIKEAPLQRKSDEKFLKVKIYKREDLSVKIFAITHVMLL